MHRPCLSRAYGTFVPTAVPLRYDAFLFLNETRALQPLHEVKARVDRGLRELLRDEDAPLVLAGTDDLLALYRQANSYRHLLGDGVEALPRQRSDEQLRDGAWAVVRRHAQEERGRVVGQYRQLAGTGGTAHDLVEVLSAAYQGQFQYLLADRRRDLWGRFDPSTREVQVHRRQEPGDEDLVNFAVAHVLAVSVGSCCNPKRSGSMARRRSA